MNTQNPLAAKKGHERIRGTSGLQPGHSRSFEIDGRDIVVQRTNDGLTVVSEDHHAVIIRARHDGLFVVTGVTETAHRSEPCAYEEAIDLALQRLRAWLSL